MRKRRGGAEDDSEVNMTPMLDVVFIMLIFFIVTATFVKEVGLDVAQPPEDKPKEFLEPLCVNKSSMLMSSFEPMS